jgi:endonuclease/exonuclease/phosphatase family metal-dependent hydrolase
VRAGKLNGKRTRGRVAAVSLLMCVGLQAGASAAAAGPPNKHPRQVLVASANVHEVFGSKDLADSSDMQVFVSRLLSGLGQPPDAVLLQEVSATSAQTIAGMLTQESGHPYSLGGAPWKTYTRLPDGGIVVRDTAILVNLDTLSVLDAGDFFYTSYPATDAAPGFRVRVKGHAYLLVADRQTGVQLSLASVHLVPSARLVSQDVNIAYREAWSRQIADSLTDVYQSWPDEAAVIAGDFNAPRKVCGAEGDCTINPFWAALTSDPYLMTDAVWSVLGSSKIDYIFSKPSVIDAGVDSTYDPETARSDPSAYYSDHRFRWALVEN